MKWPWSRRDPEGVARADELLRQVEEQDEAVEALRAEHSRLLRENNFGPKIAAALHLRRIR